jgi:hypothetical protein
VLSVYRNRYMRQRLSVTYITVNTAAPDAM